MLKRRRDGESKNHFPQHNNNDKPGFHKNSQRPNGPGKNSKKYDYRKDLSRFNRKPQGDFGESDMSSGSRQDKDKSFKFKNKKMR